MDAAWPGLAVEESNLTVQVAILRKLLGPAPDGASWIETIPRTGYRFVGDISPSEGPSDKAAIELRASVIVMPFENLTGSAAQDYLVDGITDDIIVALARFRWFGVASRGTSFAQRSLGRDPRAIGQELGASFLLEGSVRHIATRIRVTAQLVETASGTTMWSEQYNLEDAELFAVQDAIAERVVGAVEPELLRRDSVRVTHLTGDLTAWDLVRQGTWHFHKVTQATHLEARRLFREACTVDPQLAEAHFWNGRANAGLVAYGWSADPESDLREGLDAALRSIYLDGQNPYSHYSLAIVSAYSDRIPQAVLSAERAIELSPSFALGHLALGMAHLFGGDAAAAAGPLEHGLQLNPLDPQNAVWFNLLALARFFAGDLFGSLETARSALRSRPDSRPLAITLAGCYAALGKWNEARGAVQLANRLHADGDTVLVPFRRNNPQWAEQLQSLVKQIE
jgi:TolB-like protein